MPKTIAASEVERVMRYVPYLPHLLFTLFAIYVVMNAWSGDDAFITFRTIDNLIHGYGLRWNVDERVQSFTHPLWLFCLVPFTIFSSNIYFVALAVSLLLSLVTFALLIFNNRWVLPVRVLAAFGLIFSKCYVDYSTSGLENPLSHFLTALFFLTALNHFPQKNNLRVLAFIVALMATNRIDTILIAVPLLSMRAFESHRDRGWRPVAVDLALGALPLLAWETFSLFYFGFLAPNTAYAKLGAAQTRLHLLLHGILYFVDSLLRDPATLFLITVLSLKVWQQPSKIHRVALAGPLLYLLYVVNIGGDFMSGRYFSTPLLVITILFADCHPTISLKRLRPIVIGVFAGALFSTTLSAPLVSALKINLNGSDEIALFGIADERAVYWQNNSFMRVLAGRTPAQHMWAQQGLILRKSGASKVAVHGNIGMMGYYAGPAVSIIDYYALSDPLLARLPARNRADRIGHFKRDLPPGYIESVASHFNAIDDQNLRRYYKSLELITKGDLLSFERLKEIVRFNFGNYNRYREYYIIGYLISQLEGDFNFRNPSLPCESSSQWDQSSERTWNECGLTSNSETNNVTS